MSLKNFKSICDSLSQSEFNGLMSLYRHFVNHSEDLKLSDEVQGKYGKYIVEIPYAKIVDNGFLVTSQTLQNTPRVKLTGNVFNSSTYTLHLQVLYYENVNIFDDEDNDYVDIIDVNVALEPDTWVNIPLTDIGEGDIILFDANVTIEHDKTEVQGNYVTGLGISVDKSIIQTGDTATITITATDLDTLPVSGKSIQLYDGGTLLDNLTTDATGNATKTITGTGSGRHTYLAQYKSTVQSTTTEILDAYFYDQAITGHKNTNWTVGSKVTVGTPTNDGTELTISDATTSNSYQYTNTTFSGDFEAVVYIDNPSSNEAVRLGVVSGSTRGYVVQAGTEKYWKLVRKDGTTTAYYSSDGVTWTSKSMRGTDPTGAVSVYIGIYNNTSTPMTFTYKDFIVAPIESGLALTSNKSVLSYYDSETATLTATFSDGAGATVELYDASDDTLIATMNDEGDGTYTHTYTSTGAGDVGFYAKIGSLQSGTYTIEDCLIAKTTETTVTNTTGTKISTIGMDTIPNIQNTNFKFEFDGSGNGVLNIGAKTQWSSSSANYRLTIGYADGKNYWSTRTTSTSEGYGSNASTSTEYHYKIEREGTSIKFYVDGTLIQSKTVSFLSNYSTWSIYSIIWGSGTQKAKNIKIKPIGA